MLPVIMPLLKLTTGLVVNNCQRLEAGSPTKERWMNVVIIFKEICEDLQYLLYCRDVE